MVDLGTLGGSSSEARAVDDGVVAGAAGTASGGNHAFATMNCLWLHTQRGSLLLDATAPADAIADHRDSPSLTLAGGNAWKTVGTWTNPTSGSLRTLTGPGHLSAWLGLKNSDDQGTRFDLQAEILKNNVPLTSGQVHCITGVTRNPDNAVKVDVPFAFQNTAFGPSDTLSVRVSVRIGTNGAGASCGGHANATGLRLYFDAVTRPAQLATTAFK
jgi:hypothetical protein